MNDIFDIKGVMYISPFASSFFLFILILFLISIIGFIYLKLKNKIKNKEIDILKIDKEPFLKMLKKLELEDIRFFERLSFIIRFYLDKKNIISGAVNLTLNEVIKILKKEKLLNNNIIIENFLHKCNECQFSNKESGNNIKLELKYLAKELILKI